jgi:hypothetical protein
MMLHPSVQRRAQDELDHIVGRARLPSFEDQDKLVYLSSVLKESVRWHPVAPLGAPLLLCRATTLMTEDILTGVAHQSTQAVEYRGWHIPERTTVIANIWYTLQFPSVQ